MVFFCLHTINRKGFGVSAHNSRLVIWVFPNSNIFNWVALSNSVKIYKQGFTIFLKIFWIDQLMLQDFYKFCSIFLWTVMIKNLNYWFKFFSLCHLTRSQSNLRKLQTNLRKLQRNLGKYHTNLRKHLMFVGKNIRSKFWIIFKFSLIIIQK